MLFSLLLANAVFQSTDAPAQATPDVEQAGKIVMYRTATVMGAAVACPIRYKGHELVELGRGKFAEWTVKPGTYTLENKKMSVEVPVQPGETRYVRCVIKPGFMSGYASLENVYPEAFKAKADELQRKDVIEPAD